MSEGTQRHVARALRAGGPEVIEIGVEDFAPPKAGEALVKVPSEKTAKGKRPMIKL